MTYSNLQVVSGQKKRGIVTGSSQLAQHLIELVGGLQ
jgi:hypothetical protein